MTTATVGVDSQLPGVTRAQALLRGPFLIWTALLLNVLTFGALPMVVPIPHAIGQMACQGALPLAILLGLLANPGGLVRPSFFITMLTIFAIVSFMVSIHSQFMVGSTYRAVRLLAFVLVLWLLTAWWGRSDLILLRCHLLCLRVLVVSVLIGVLLAPGKAFSYGGRLTGAIYPLPPTQVAHYSAVLLGCTIVLWFCGATSGRTALLTLLGVGAALIGTHTRTALLGLVVGLVVAGASLFLGHARVRRTSAMVGVLVVTTVTLFAPLIVDWLLRGQSRQDATGLTGRTQVWSAVIAMRRSRPEELFGSGLSNKSFNGLAIDSNWVATYLDSGWFGLFVDAALLITLLLLAIMHRRGLRRAIALFLVTYCLIASFTETGLGDASPYLMELFLAGSVLAAPAGVPGRRVPT